MGFKGRPVCTGLTEKASSLYQSLKYMNMKVCVSLNELKGTVQYALKLLRHVLRDHDGGVFPISDMVHAIFIATQFPDNYN